MRKITVLLIVLVLLASPFLYGQKRETRQVESFTSISFRFPGKLYIKQGSPQRVELVGDDDILEKVETRVSRGRLIIGREDDDDWFKIRWNDDDDLTVYITVPKIEGISVGGSGDVIGQGPISGGNMKLAVSGSGSMTIDLKLNGELDTSVSGSGNLEVSGNAKVFEGSVSGSGRIDASVNADAAEFGVSGSGRISARGQVETINATVSGSGKVLASELAARRADVRITGSGDIELNISDELEAAISGSGSVSYKGNPSKVNSHSSGSGRVRKM